MTIYSIYKITNTLNGKVYIGYTENTKKRFKDHLNNAKTVEYVLYQAMRKHGVDYFKFEIIYQSLDGEYLRDTMEAYFIIEYNSYYEYGKGYNMTHGGCLMDETRKINISKKISDQWANDDQSGRVSNIRAAIKEKWKDPEYRKKMMIARQNQWKDAKNNHVIKQFKQKANNYIVISPNGTEYITNNLKDFCKEHGLSQPSKMYYTATGKLVHYKKWKCRKLQ